MLVDHLKANRGYNWFATHNDACRVAAISGDCAGRNHSVCHGCSEVVDAPRRNHGVTDRVQVDGLVHIQL